MKYLAIVAMIIMLSTGSMVSSQDRVDIRLYRTGDDTVVDTAYLGYDHQIQIMIDNSFTIGGMCLPFKIYSDPGTVWSWVTQPYGGLGSQQVVTVLFLCRLGYPDGSALNATGLVVTETDLDANSPDTLIVGGGAVWPDGVAPGDLEPMIAFHLAPQTITGDVGTICIDSIEIIYPSCKFAWDAADVEPVVPQFDGPFCWPVVEFEPILGDFNLDGEVNVGDVVKMIEYFFLMINHIAPMETGDVNCDGQMNVGDAVYLIAYIFLDGPAPGCP